jgi:hypothetical protein
MQPINHIPSPSSPAFTLPFYKYSPRHCTYFTVLSFSINSEVNVQRVFHCIPSVRMLWFGQFNPFHYSPLTPYLPTLTIQQPSIHIFISSIIKDVMYFDIVYSLSFSFPFPPLPSFIELLCYYKHVWNLRLYMAIWEKTCGLCLPEPGLLHLICPLIASIYLQTTWSHFSLWLNKTAWHIYMYIYIV